MARSRPENCFKRSIRPFVLSIFLLNKKIFFGGGCTRGSFPVIDCFSANPWCMKFHALSIFILDATCCFRKFYRQANSISSPQISNFAIANSLIIHSFNFAFIILATRVTLPSADFFVSKVDSSQYAFFRLLVV